MYNERPQAIFLPGTNWQVLAVLGIGYYLPYAISKGCISLSAERDLDNRTVAFVEANTGMGAFCRRIPYPVYSIECDSSVLF